MKNQQGGGSLPLAPTLRFSATPSAGVFATCPQGRRFERTPATPPMLSHGFDFANAKSKNRMIGKSLDFPNPCGNIK